MISLEPEVEIRHYLNESNLVTGNK